MIKKLLFIIILTASFSNALAQFEANKHYAGPMIGLSFLGSTIQIGGGYEYGLDVENFGRVGIGGIIRYWAYSENFGLGEWQYSDFLIGAQGNYHFVVDDRRFDPWAGLVLAYDAGSVKFSGPAGINYITPSYGGLWLGLHGGLRYWIQPNIALSGRIGFGTLGYGALDFGVDFKF
jgi:hypothetical protein